MAQTLHFQGKSVFPNETIKWDITVHNRTELTNLVRTIRNLGYQTFTLTTDDGVKIVECQTNGAKWHNICGFRL